MFASVRAGVLAIGATTAFAFLATTALAETLTFRVFLDGRNEVPANKATGTGFATVILDTETKKVVWTIAYMGLTGPATAAHFHGPADETESAGIQVPLTGSLTSTITGERTLTNEVFRMFDEGQIYINIHTAANPDGEIRGQIGIAQERS